MSRRPDAFFLCLIILLTWKPTFFMFRTCLTYVFLSIFSPIRIGPLISAPYPSSPRPNSRKSERRSVSHSRLRTSTIARSPSLASSESIDSSASISSVSSMPSSATSSSSVSSLTRLRSRRRRARQNQNADEHRGRLRISRSGRTRKPLTAKDINILNSSSSTNHAAHDSLAPHADHHTSNPRRHRRHRKQADPAYEKSREDRARRKSMERAQLHASPAATRHPGADGMDSGKVRASASSSGHRRHLHRAQSFAQVQPHVHGRGHSHAHMAVRPARASYGHASLATHADSSEPLLNHSRRSHHNCKRSRAGQTCPHCHNCAQLRSGHASTTANVMPTAKEHARKSDDRKHDKRSRAFGALFLVPNPWASRAAGSGTGNDFRELKLPHHHGDGHGRKRAGRFHVR